MYFYFNNNLLILNSSDSNWALSIFFFDQKKIYFFQSYITKNRKKAIKNQDRYQDKLERENFLFNKKIGGKFFRSDEISKSD
jgi:hypothetical protein